MKIRSLIVLICFTLSMSAYAIQFETYFTNQSMRVDYMRVGDAHTDNCHVIDIKKEPYWGGSHTHLIDTYKYGKYFFEVYDVASGTLLYSRGFSSLYGEWQTTAEADSISKAFYEVVTFPWPKQKVRLKMYKRDFETGRFKSQLELFINPNDYAIDPQLAHIYPVYEALQQGDAAHKVDIVILPDGYTAEEMDLFKKDCDTFVSEMFKYDPYKQAKDKFNVRGVLAPSAQSGTDIPADTVWKQTLLNTRFYTFGSERYCMTTDYKSVRDVAANAPYDQIYILVNTKKYGGGAILNHYNVSVNSNKMAGLIFIHELGHGFAGLADEYYDSSTSYDGFYNHNVEPWEPNITTFVDFDSKWKHLLDKNTPIPTPSTPEWNGKMGVYEGGGYVAKGIYRPRQDCLMKTFNGTTFCDACKEAVNKMIKFYTE